jgi:antirestriction protein ArdC
MNGRATLYETITNDIITELEKGVVPWVPPWENGGGTLSLLRPRPNTRVTSRHFD